LPQSFVDIPVERLEVARAWLASQPQVDSARIALLGISKGAEFALIAASHMPWITSVVAIVPTDVVWQGWGPDVAPGTERSSFALRGKALPFVPNKDFPQELAGFQTGADVRFRRPQDKGRAAHPQAAVEARIRVEDFKGPLLVAGGIEDQVWASGMMAQNIAERRAAHGLETVSLVFTDAGHLLSGSGWAPTTQYNAGPNKTGGTPQANARAQAEVWASTLAFLNRTLGVGK
jgi:dienelactone hydrolase